MATSNSGSNEGTMTPKQVAEVPQLTVFKGGAFGNVHYYPKCDTAKQLVTLHGTKTMTPLLVATAKLLGYKVIIEAEITEAVEL